MSEPVRVWVFGDAEDVLDRAVVEALEASLGDEAAVTLRASPPSDESAGVGTCYFDVCRASAGADRDAAVLSAAKLRRILEGADREATFVYACHSPSERRW